MSDTTRVIARAIKETYSPSVVIACVAWMLFVSALSSFTPYRDAPLWFILPFCLTAWWWFVVPVSRVIDKHLNRNLGVYEATEWERLEDQFRK